MTSISSSPMSFPDDLTEPSPHLDPSFGAVERFQLAVIDGPKRGLTWESKSDRCSIGSSPANDLELEDATVSRFHCEITIGERGARLRDLDSRNGTILDGVSVIEAFLKNGSLVRLGNSVVRFESGGARIHMPLSAGASFGTLVGVSAAMRATFALLERAASTTATVLLEGETGTGKEDAAESVHRASARAAAPMVVIDCGAIPPSLLESELFGHERGAFTGATQRRIGAFEEAAGGTIFLDEIGELPIDLQPKLLRVLEQKEIRRVGSNGWKPVDVRVIAATNRDLRTEVNAGRFRSDLYFRLAVLRIPMPPLRSRPEDVTVLAERILATLGAGPDELRALLTPDYVTRLRSAAWPGNVRELRNYLERCLVFQGELPLADGGPGAQADDSGKIDARVPYPEARQRVVSRFERQYLEELLALHQGKVAAAARAAGVDRAYLYRLIQRNGIKT
jgi:two-component system, NtrC family, response regulator GlrR